jgi:hypothetical protein
VHVEVAQTSRQGPSSSSAVIDYEGVPEAGAIEFRQSKSSRKRAEYSLVNEDPSAAKRHAVANVDRPASPDTELNMSSLLGAAAARAALLEPGAKVQHGYTRSHSSQHGSDASTSAAAAPRAPSLSAREPSRRSSSRASPTRRSSSGTGGAAEVDACLRAQGCEGPVAGGAACTHSQHGASCPRGSPRAFASACAGFQQLDDTLPVSTGASLESLQLAAPLPEPLQMVSPAGMRVHAHAGGALSGVRAPISGGVYDAAVLADWFEYLVSWHNQQHSMSALLGGLYAFACAQELWQRAAWAPMSTVAMVGFASVVYSALPAAMPALARLLQRSGLTDRVCYATLAA